MNESKIIKTIKILLYLTALTPLVLAARFSFPYVTVRTIFFRLIIELALLLTLALIAGGVIGIKKDQESNRAVFKKNYFFWLLLALIGVETLAAVFGRSLAMSFFSNMERMWGIFTVIHLFIFYLLARSFFKEKEWRAYVNIFLAVSLLAGLYGIIQKFPSFFKIYVFEAGISRIGGTLGNPAYLAIYLLFSLALALYFLIKYWPTRLKYFYLAVLAVNSFAFLQTEIRGAYLGMLAGGFLAMILYLWLGPSRKYKIGIAGFLILLALILSFGFLNPQNGLIKKLPIIKRLSTISLTAVTAKTRLMSWNAALKGIKERPILGVGMENYNVLFNKYFKAEYYSLAPTETFFDRAHNQFLNLMAESGILALLIYLGFPLAIGYYLIRGRRLGKLELPELLVFSAISAAYFVHVFFVFDDLNSFLFFLVLIAYLEFKFHGDNLAEIGPADNKVHQANYGLKALTTLLAIIIIYSAYNYNYKVLQAAHLSALAYMSPALNQTVEYYNQALGLNIISSENVTINYGDYLAGWSNEIDKIKADKNNSELFKQAMEKVRQALEREIKLKPADAFLYLKLAKLNNLEYLFYGDKKYIGQAAANANQGLNLSPERLQIYYNLGETYVIAGEYQKAIDVLIQALALNADFDASYYYLGRAYLSAGQLDQAYDYIISKAIKEKEYRPQNNLILLYLAGQLIDKKDYKKVIQVYETIIGIDPGNADVTAALAAVYLQVDDYDKAIKTASRAARLDPALAEETTMFIELIKTGQIERLKKSINN